MALLELQHTSINNFFNSNFSINDFKYMPTESKINIYFNEERELKEIYSERSYKMYYLDESLLTEKEILFRSRTRPINLLYYNLESLQVLRWK